MNFYSEWDHKTALWLRELVKRGLIPDGIVDERSIVDLKPDELKEFTQVHLFAGIGGWSYALGLAGWPSTRRVWTGSCPCQPYSAAGKGLGDADPRNLWPAMFRLIRECKPAIVFGEQVEGAIRYGWLDGICADLEAEGYAVGAHVLGAHSVGAPHIRQRLYWMADAESSKRWTEQQVEREAHGRNGSGRSGDSGGLADAARGRLGIDRGAQRQARHADKRGENSGLGDADVDGSQQGRSAASIDGYGRSAESDGGTGWMGNASRPRLEGFAGNGDDGPQPRRINQESNGSVAAPSTAWSDFDLLPCADGKARRVESGTFPLAHGVPARVVRLRGYGNAIVPQVAAAFIKAYLETKNSPL